MTQANERINSPISTPELERRWAEVRAAMAEQRIDALLMQSNNDWDVKSMINVVQHG